MKCVIVAAPRRSLALVSTVVDPGGRYGTQNCRKRPMLEEGVAGIPCQPTRCGTNRGLRRSRRDASRRIAVCSRTSSRRFNWYRSVPLNSIQICGVKPRRGNHRLTFSSMEAANSRDPAANFSLHILHYVLLLYTAHLLIKSSGYHLVDRSTVGIFGRSFVCRRG